MYKHREEKSIINKGGLSTLRTRSGLVRFQCEAGTLPPHHIAGLMPDHQQLVGAGDAGGPVPD